MILRRANGNARAPSLTTKNENFGSRQALFDHQTSPAAPNRRSLIAATTAASAVVAVLGDHDAFAGRQTVGFQHDRKPELARPDDCERVVERLSRCESARSARVPRHERLRERLARFEPRRRRGRTEEAAGPRSKTGRRCPRLSGSSGPTT